MSEEASNVLQQVLDRCLPLYMLPKDDAAASVLIPALNVSESVDVMMGFFSSHSLGEIAPGLATYLGSSTAPLRLIVSPFISREDSEALAAGVTDPSELIAGLLTGGSPDADELAMHTLACLAWLISQGRLVIKIAVLRNALFHPKVWLFKAGDQQAAFHGSANMTQAALVRNREQLSLSRSWRGSDPAETCERLSSEFESLWSGGDKDCLVVELPKAVQEGLLKEFKSDRMPIEDDFKKLWRKLNGFPEQDSNELLSGEAQKASFKIPTWLNYKEGDFAHQGRAVEAWRAANFRGILEMATGSGKTLTAMIGAHQLHTEVGPLLIVVAAPYKVLVQQWCSEIEDFGLRPIDLTAAHGPAGREKEIASARRRLRMGVSPAEALVVTNTTLGTSEFQRQVARFDGPKLLIGDECHNLGAAGFLENAPQFFEYRLGLSATPIRQYDAEGTDRLFEFFGQPCFSFTLEDAIGRCLTHYDYHVRFVELTADEMEEWRELTAQISALAWKIEAGIEDEGLERLLLKRRKVLETASAKMTALAELLDQVDRRALRYTLVYATDKDPRQLEHVNQLLSDRNILFHQLTAEETADKAKTRMVLNRFQAGELQVLTAKRVLDEGVNVPQIMQAYVLASTTVKRQWVQRRGRLLRTCKEIGKDHAVIHDLVALPPLGDGSGLDTDSKKIARSELDRVWEFARLSRNGAAPGGPFEAVEYMRELLTGG